MRQRRQWAGDEGGNEDRGITIRNGRPTAAERPMMTGTMHSGRRGNTQM
jgi:hypothetical protein